MVTNQLQIIAASNIFKPDFCCEHVCIKLQIKLVDENKLHIHYTYQLCEQTASILQEN